MSSEQHRPEQKSDAGIPVATPAGERARREDEAHPMTLHWTQRSREHLSTAPLP